MKFTHRSRVREGRLALALALMGVAALALAACDSGSTSAPPTATVPATTVPAATAPPAGGASDLTPTPPQAASGGGEEVKVDLKEWAVDLNPKELSAGKVKFDVSNTGAQSHDLVILDSAGAEVGRTPVFKSADGTQTLEVDLKPGTYKFLCDVPGHAKQGMTTDVTVK